MGGEHRVTPGGVAGLGGGTAGTASGDHANQALQDDPGSLYGQECWSSAGAASARLYDEANRVAAPSSHQERGNFIQFLSVPVADFTRISKNERVGRPCSCYFLLYFRRNLLLIASGHDRLRHPVVNLPEF